MAVAAPAPVSSPPPAATPPPTRTGTLRDTGTVRRESVRASAWTTTGTAKVQGDVDVGTGAASGLVSIGGTLSATSFRAKGTFEVVGPTEVHDALTLEGTIHLRSAVHAGAVDVRGTLRSSSDLRVDRALRVTGTLEAPSAHVGLLELTGAAELPGDLEAAVSVRARFRGDSRLGTVRANAVALEGPPSAWIPTMFRKVFGGSARIHVNRIEADTVALSAVDVQFVHAREIVLGPGAHVTEVEGKVVRRHPSSRVGPESRSDPPHGLSR
ncbi:MAG: hypothetical protein WBF81_04865 [Thermoplasmata archaeon]